ncbi:TRAM/LAG1/CLN8 homology domain protein [Kalmanozyma brasiliensis GHG001]|uniref:TLC domain-containing protein n=1 Tax=Kalmanozyma brasiliensis (strain GHG001) TaxID=1365824 RepID=V5GI71_KALBG|nr:TRAM/LAG1/CLN8 homology domain protein [Kalmanozyma brasiliensis GHG001]EST05667.1 TRAM/LAG1/CLN8 homology domain protein [Kalmanozyma brasiliensis GHG001]
MTQFVFADRFVLPEGSALSSNRLHIIFYASLVVQHAIFHALSQSWLKGDSKEMLKKRCWILTTVASFVMCGASLPYLYDLILGGFDLHALRPRTKTVAEPLAAFFVAYLLSDLTLGSIYYRKLINLSSGWIHHIAYTFLFSLWVHKGWAHIAATAAIFELPTLIMGVASIYPPLRSNMAFTVTFFSTRVFYHFALLIACVTPHGRNAPGINGSWGPAISLIATYPMHVWWGYKCICSIRRRMYKRKLEAAQVAKEKASLASAAGQLFNGMPAPDISSAVNTPATTPGAGATHATANFGATGPVHAAFARAAAAARPPANLLLPKRRRGQRTDGESPVKHPLLSRRLTPKYINSKSVFTAPVAPDGAGPHDTEPFLAIRSPAEARDRARRLVADAVRKVWINAPASWRRQFEEEAGVRPKGLGATGRMPSYTTDESSEEYTEAESDSAAQSGMSESRARRYLQAQRSRVRRAVLRAVRTAINGRDADGVKAVTSHDGNVITTFADGAVAAAGDVRPTGIDRTLLSLDFSSLVRYLPPDFLGQDSEVREFPVEQVAQGSRRKRIVGQIRRRMEVARSDFVVFD